MESVDRSDASETSKKVLRTIDRVTLGKLEADKLEKWLKQINESSRGFLTLTKSDVVNFLIRLHRDEFIPKELSVIRADHYDPIKHITWITPQIKMALMSGDIPRVAELQEELRGVELSVIRDANAATLGALIPRSKKTNKPKTKRTSNSMPENDDLPKQIEQIL